MIEVLGIKLTYETIGFIVAFVLSEVIGMSKLKENSVAQLVKGLIDSQRPQRKEDEKVSAIKGRIEELLTEIKALDD
jgi:hypothetical protein